VIPIAACASASSGSSCSALTAAGRKQLAGERAEFERLVRAIQLVLEAT
jgi:hypothetical protein